MERIGLFVTGLVALGESILASLAGARSQDAPDIEVLFLVAAVVLVLAGSLTILRIGRDLAQSVLTALAGGAFAIGLVDLSLKPLDQAGRYGSLEPGLLVGACLLLFLVFRGGYESGPMDIPMLRRLDAWLDARLTRPQPRRSSEHDKESPSDPV
jgi:hypothetical protein